MTESKVSFELAKDEFYNWLETKKGISKEKIDRKPDLKEAVETIAYAISDGVISIDADGFIIQKLKSSDVKETELKFKPKIKARDLDKMKSYKDDNGKSRAMISALTDVFTGVIDNLDTNDIALSQTIALFYYLP
jgi:hypothetical protein